MKKDNLAGGNTNSAVSFNFRRNVCCNWRLWKFMEMEYSSNCCEPCKYLMSSKNKKESILVKTIKGKKFCHISKLKQDIGFVKHSEFKFCPFFSYNGPNSIHFWQIPFTVQISNSTIAVSLATRSHLRHISPSFFIKSHQVLFYLSKVIVPKFLKTRKCYEHDWSCIVSLLQQLRIVGSL